MFIAEFRQSTAMYGYDAIENTYRLRKCLRGDARQAVECLLINPQNVEQILNTLQLLFGRPESLVRCQIAKARAIRPISEHEISQLIPFATTVQSLVAFLSNESTWQHLNNPALLEELVDKLPPSKRLEWAKEASVLQNPTIQHLSVWLSNLAYYAGIATAGAGPPTSGYHRSTRNDNRSHKPNSILAVNVERTESVTVKCGHCESEEHYKLVDCKSFLELNIDDRWSSINRQMACFSCLLRGHGIRRCRRKKVCTIGQCKQMHHPLLHRDTISEPVPGNEAEVDIQAHVNICQTSSEDGIILFRTVPVILYGDNTQITTFAVFDEGSAITMLDAELASELQLEGETQTIAIQCCGGKPQSKLTRNVSLMISGIAQSPRKYTLQDVQTFDKIVLPNQNTDVDELKRKYEHLRDATLPDLRNAKPKILIGLRHKYLGLHQEEMRGGSLDPVAAKTKLGWIVYGIDKYLPLDIKQFALPYSLAGSFGVQIPNKKEHGKCFNIIWNAKLDQLTSVIRINTNVLSSHCLPTKNALKYVARSAVEPIISKDDCMLVKLQDLWKKIHSWEEHVDYNLIVRLKPWIKPRSRWLNQPTFLQLPEQLWSARTAGSDANTNQKESSSKLIGEPEVQQEICVVEYRDLVLAQKKISKRHTDSAIASNTPSKHQVVSELIDSRCIYENKNKK